MDSENSNLEKLNELVSKTIKSRDFDNLRSILTNYLKGLIEKTDLSNSLVKTIQIHYNNNIHKAKIFSYRNDTELVYKIIDKMYSDVRFILYYDWDYSKNILDNLICILVYNDNLTVTKKILDVI